MFSLTQQSSFVRGTAQVSSSSGTSRRVSLSLFFYMNRRLNVWILSTVWRACRCHLLSTPKRSIEKKTDAKTLETRAEGIQPRTSRVWCAYTRSRIQMESCKSSRALMKTSKSRPKWWPPLTHFSLFIITCIIIKRNSPLLLRPSNSHANRRQGPKLASIFRRALRV